MQQVIDTIIEEIANKGTIELTVGENVYSIFSDDYCVDINYTLDKNDLLSDSIFANDYAINGDYSLYIESIDVIDNNTDDEFTIDGDIELAKALMEDPTIVDSGDGTDESIDRYIEEKY